MKSIFPIDTWSIAEGEFNGNPIVIRMRGTMPSQPDRVEFARLIVISWNFGPTESGMPDNDAHERMDAFEAALEEGSEQRGVAVQVVSLTGDGRKEWRYYTHDTGAFLQSLNEDLVGHDPYPIEMSEFDDPEWNGLAEFLGLPDA